MTSDEKIKKLSDTAKRVLPTGNEAWLYGSQARGTANRDSDWDILVLVNGEALGHEDFGIYAYPYYRNRVGHRCYGIPDTADEETVGSRQFHTIL